MDNLGAIGGPLLAIALVTRLGTRDAMLVSVVPGLIILYAIRTTPRPKNSSATRSVSASAGSRAPDPPRDGDPHSRPRPQRRGQDRARPLHGLQPRGHARERARRPSRRPPQHAPRAPP